MASSETYNSTGVEYYQISNFKFSNGITKDIKLAYKSLNPTSEKKALVCTCFAGIINTTLNFSTGALKDYHVIIIAMLGNGESSSPSNDPSFPADYSLRYQDCVNAQYILLTKHFEIKSLDVVVGFSMGGQQAYYWAVIHGSSPTPFVKNAVVICGSAKTSGHNYAFLEGPIAALTTSFDYDGGKYKANGVKPRQGLRAFGRAYAAWLTSPEWFRQELWRKVGAASLKDWLYPPEGKAGHEAWDPEDLVTLARMWQAGNIGDVGGNGDYREALKGIETRVLVMPSQTDQYFPPEDGENEVKFLKNGVFDPIPTVWGHIGGASANQEDVTWKDERIRKFLTDGK
ncbi:Homoserine O-acetyltransferase [Lachnellula hyalina]|uniref:Homoserine O-acetyltransferase n=1 Tax=Lachnellula hyalina TaxID=1316788 RepID=A0A8H8RD29_9HELO|nr:Homoserine O-acetyltransferase [Lachnellula hyalina]TVY31147.1 Homoserine O-acetyltransferase [Lachnellula hyalina]